jgi:DNA-directed RNA polymerase subunit M/transcription elongation factor TFIIS
MKFCQNCDNLLYLKINDSSEEGGGVSDSGAEPTENVLNKKCELKYVCRMCNEEYDSNESDSCVFNINFNLDNIKKMSFINDFIYDDITLPRAEGIKCPNAKCPDQKPEIVYIQYDKENMKYIYICLSCHRDNIQPHIW